MSAVEQIKPLTSLRAFAAFWVVSMHLGEFYSLCPALKHFRWLTGAGGLGVDLFFVLSGFILCYSHATRDAGISLRTYFQFIWLRVARIYPAYLAALAAIVSFVLTARHFGFPITDANYSTPVLWPELFMVHMWSWQFTQFGWNAVDWSVSAEWFAYLFIFPLVCVLLTRIKSVWAYLLLATVLLTGLAVPWPGVHANGTPGLSPIITITLEFFAGAMIYGLRRNWKVPSTKMVNALLSLAIAIPMILLACSATAGVSHRPELVTCFGLGILALSYKNGILYKFLSVRVLVYLGEISYSLYLTHQIVQRVLKIIFHPDRFDGMPAFTRFIIFSIYLVAILGAAMALFHFVEQPCRRYLRKKSPFENTALTSQPAAKSGVNKSRNSNQ